MNCIYVMIGGALGALCRYGVAQLCTGVRFLSMPTGTFAVNVAGCFVLGLLTGLGERHTGISPQMMLMLTTGFCGAFTTFSTFSAETIKACESGHALQALIYVVASITIGFLLFWLGKRLAC